MINIVEGCCNIADIEMRVCYKLSDTSLFSIAENCPHLETIDLNFGNGITLLGLLELLQKCLKLRQITSGFKNLPEIIVDQLKQRVSK